MALVNRLPPQSSTATEHAMQPQRSTVIEHAMQPQRGTVTEHAMQPQRGTATEHAMQPQRGTATENPQERDYSAETKAARRLQRQADAKRRAQERCGDTTAQDGTDGAASQQCISDVTQLAVPDADAAQPTTMPGTGSMQCPECNQVLCGTQELAFFKRVNKMQGLEVHLMLKPEIKDMPPDIILMPACGQGAVATWQCTCGHKLGDTRNVGPRKAAMTAFKSSSVKLFGQLHKSKKSQWPRIYAHPPFNGIEVRHWAEFQA